MDIVHGLCTVRTCSYVMEINRLFFSLCVDTTWDDTPEPVLMQAALLLYFNMSFLTEEFC